MSALHLTDMADHPKAMPNNIDAEHALLGLVLYENDAFERVADSLRPEHFYEGYHGRIWAVITDLMVKGMHADVISVAERLNHDPAFGEMGGLRFFADLVDHAPTSLTMVNTYAEIIRDAAVRRGIIALADEASAAAKRGEAPGADVARDLELGLFAMAEAGPKGGGFQPFATAIDAALDSAAAAYRRDGELVGVASGLIDLDRRLGGLHPSDLIILAARPSMGKTALATNIAFHAASRLKKQVAFYSCEMSAEQLAMRLLASASGMSSDKIRRGEIQAHEFERLHEARDLIRSIPLHIDETGAISVAKLAARARRLKRTEGLDLIIVDYLQLVTGSRHYKGGERVQEVSEISAALKALAKELAVPVIALSQLSRQVESRDDKRPQLSDLRDSGTIEQDADVVMFLYREAYYLKRTEPKPGTTEHLNWLEQVNACEKLADVIIGKQRHGPIGTVRLSFDENTTQFGNLARESDFAAARLPYGGDE